MMLPKFHLIRTYMNIHCCHFLPVHASLFRNISTWQQTTFPLPLPHTQTSLSICAQRKAGRRQRASPAVCTLPMVPCGVSPVTRFALASAMRKTKHLRRRLPLPNGKNRLSCPGHCWFLFINVKYNNYYSFKIVRRFWLVSIPWVILHNQLAYHK